MTRVVEIEVSQVRYSVCFLVLVMQVLKFAKVARGEGSDVRRISYKTFSKLKPSKGGRRKGGKRRGGS